MARSKFRLKGVNRFMRNFNLAVKFLGKTTRRGLIEAAITLWREAEPGTPLDVGNLRSSFFIVTVDGDHSPSSSGSFEGDEAGERKKEFSQITAAAQSAVKEMETGGTYVVMFGYTANYAVFVHEKVDATFKRPGAEARWLYKAMQRSKNKMLDEIAEHASFE